MTCLSNSEFAKKGIPDDFVMLLRHLKADQSLGIWYRPESQLSYWKIVRLRSMWTIVKMQARLDYVVRSWFEQTKLVERFMSDLWKYGYLTKCFLYSFNHFSCCIYWHKVEWVFKAHCRIFKLIKKHPLISVLSLNDKENMQDMHA